jgi:hypothetical protein
MLLNYF